MSILAIPPQRVEDTDRAKDFLFATLGENHWTEDLYLAFSDSVTQLVELSEGRLVVRDIPTPRHQDIVLNLAAEFRSWTRAHGGKVFIAPMPIRLWPNKFRGPDVMLYAAEHLDRVGEQYGGPPDLVVEVLSPGTADLDMNDKSAEYAQAGIPEYWLVDTAQTSLTQYVLDDSRYRLHAQHGGGSVVLAATLPGLAVSLETVYAGA